MSECRLNGAGCYGGITPGSSMDEAGKGSVRFWWIDGILD